MSLDYSVIETFKLLENCFKYDIFIAIIVSCISLIIILNINKDRKIINYIILEFNMLLIVIVAFYYLEGILTFKFSNPINNMYVYFFSSIIFLIINTIMFFKSKYKKINYIFYGLVLINLLFSLFITYYLKNIDLIVIGNIFPMIKFGNIIYISYYIFVVICFFARKFRRVKPRRPSHRLRFGGILWTIKIKEYLRARRS